MTRKRESVIIEAMALTRKDKPDWFALTDRVRAIFELEIASQADLARHLKVPGQRVWEWIHRIKEPRSQIALKIERWTSAHEAEMNGDIETSKRYAKQLEGKI